MDPPIPPHHHADSILSRDGSILAQALDDLLQITVQTCATPIAMIMLSYQGQSLVFGVPQILTVSAAAQGVILAAHTIAELPILVIPNVAAQAGFETALRSLADPPVHCYAGVPLRHSNGAVLGVLCVMDTAPRGFTPAQQDALLRLGRQAIRLVEAEALIVKTLAATRQSYPDQVMLWLSDLAWSRSIQSMLDALPYQMTILDDNGIIMIVNRQWQQFSDANAGTLVTSGVGSNYLSVCDRAVGADALEAPLVAQGIRAVLTRQRETFFLEYPCDSLTEQRWFRMVVLLLANDDRTRVLVVHENITTRKHAEAALRASDQQKQAILDAALDAIIAMDHQGCIMEFNPAAEAMFGYRRDAAIGQELAKLIIPPGLRLQHTHGLARYLATGESTVLNRRITLTAMRADGSEFPVELAIARHSSDVPATFSCAVRDLSQQHAAQQQLQAGEVRLQHVLDSMLEGCQIIDRSWRYRYLNQGAVTHSGMGRDELLGRTMMEVYPGIEATPLFGALQHCMHERLPRRMENQFTYPDGAVAWFDVSIQPVEEGLFVLSIDITMRKQAEETLVATNDRLEQRVVERTQQLETSNRNLMLAKSEADAANEAKSNFLSRMSHELRTPLNAILGFGQLLELDDLTPLQHESVHHLVKGGRHLLALINEVLNITQVESGHLDISLETVALIELVPECCALMRPLAAQRLIQLDDRGDTLHGLYLTADRRYLKQVLINLIANAIKYNRPGGAVTLICTPRPEGRLRIAIQDTGLGIAPDDIAKLFTPFERLGAISAGIEGSGLGLVLSQSLVTALGGTLGVDSSPGTGSIFWIDLDQTDAPAGNHGAAPVEPSAGATKRRVTVLCIEDNPANLRLMELIFARRPTIALLNAMVGSLGLELAQQHRPNLIILDLHLPDITGAEILAQLQQLPATRDIPVIIISADATPGQIERILAAGATAYLTKPLDVAHFLRSVDTILDIQP
jgi:PAS domain S-box-containing protein